MHRPHAIRRALAGDAPELARLLTPLGYPRSEADLRAVWDAWEADGNVALVAEGSDGLIGVITLHSMVVLHRPRPVGRITSLFVDAPARGAGLGRALMEAAENALRERGCSMVEVTSHRRRTDAHTFYERFGYERTSYRFARELR